MSFGELNQKITEHKNYKIVANHIMENNIDLMEFFNSLECLNEEGFFTDAGKKIDSWGQNLKNMWNKFRGRPYNIESVIDLLQKAKNYLKDNSKYAYEKEIKYLAKIINDIELKEKSKIRLDVPRIASEKEDAMIRSDSGSESQTVDQGYDSHSQSVDFSKPIDKYTKPELVGTKLNKNRRRKQEFKKGVIDSGNEIRVSSAGPGFSYTT